MFLVAISKANAGGCTLLKIVDANIRLENFSHDIMHMFCNPMHRKIVNFLFRQSGFESPVDKEVQKKGGVLECRVHIMFNHNE